MKTIGGRKKVRARETKEANVDYEVVQKHTDGEESKQANVKTR